LATLEWDFRVVNANTVDRALAGIERRVAVHNQRIARTLGQSGRAPGRGAGSAGGAANQETAFANKVAVDRLRAETKANLAIQKSQLKRVETVERSELSAINRAKAARLSGVAQEKAFTSKVAIEKMRADAKAQLSGQKMAFQRVQSAERAELSAIRRIESARISSDARAARAAAQEIKVRARAADQAWKARERASVKTGRAVGSSVTGAVGGVGRLAGAALSIGGGFALAGALSAQQSEQAQASKLANQADMPGQKGQILKEAQNVRGFTGSEALSGMESFVTLTGDLQTARTLIGELGDLSLATGTDLGDMGAVAGEVFNALKTSVTDPVERMKQMKDVMRTLAQQGTMGAVEIRDLASQFGKLGAATQMFEGKSSDKLKLVGAFAQVAKESGGSASAEDAATSVARFGSDVVTNRKKFAAIGVDVTSKTDKTKLRDPMEIIADVLDKTGGDVTKTSGLLGMESRKVLQGFTGTYGEAEKREKGSGKAAVLAKAAAFSGATLTQGDINERVGSRMEDSDMQFKEAMKQFNAAMGTQMLPAITKLIPKFVELIGPMTKIAEAAAHFAAFLIDNPLKGFGAILAAKAAADFVAAGLPAAIGGQMNAIVSGFSSSMGAGASAVGKFAGAAGLAGLALYAAYDQFSKLTAENKNLGIDDAAKVFGDGKGDWGLSAMFTSLDAKNNAEAVANRKAEDGKAAAEKAAADTAAALASRDMAKASTEAAVELRKLKGGALPNRGDQPTNPVK